jgi:8-oxo-dGTP pyrophosphatase MutT (NUDIX family)
MKKLSVVFVICFEGDKKYVMMGKQAEGKRMPGIRNGYGGKCDYLEVEGRWETTEECAVRELREETGSKYGEEIKSETGSGTQSEINVSTSELKKIGNIVNGDKFVDFFVLVLKEKINITDNDEMVDVRWFDVEKPELFVDEMLSGDDIIIKELQRYVSDPENINNPEKFEKFKIDKTNDIELNKQVKNIFGTPSLK